MARKKLNSITWPNMPNDTYYLDADKVAYDAEETYADGSTGKALQNKAEIDGYYSEMSVGDAEQLISSMYVEDSAPYGYRTTGGSADVGNREYVDAIVGGTVAFNQLGKEFTANNWQAESGVTVSFDNGVAEFTSTAMNNGIKTGGLGVRIIGGHKYLALVSVKSLSSASGQKLRIIASGQATPVFDIANITTSFSTVGGVASAGSNQTLSVYIYPTSSSALNVTILLKDFLLIDLTSMFGTTIADYIYSLEQANAGAGVAFFKSLFPKPYYAYNAGELMSVSGLVSHDMIGFNAWDEEWEVGALISDGSVDSTLTTRRTTSFIRVVPNAAYYFPLPCLNGRCAFYDADKKLISYNGNGFSTYINTIPSGVSYIRVTLSSSYGTTYNHDICINLSWSGWRNGEYEPYEKHSYPLDDSLTLRGIPKLDAQNNLYYDGDEYKPDGSVSRRYGVVDLGTLNWNYTSGDGGVFYAQFTDTPHGTLNMICPKYTTVKYADKVDKTISRYYAFQNGLNIVDSAYTDATAFKAAMNGVYLVYELAEPTTETAEPYNEIQICNDFGTEEFVSTDIVPVGHNTRYPANLRDKLQHLPDLADGDGYYMIGQSNKQMHLELFRIPKAPTTDGTYTLKATVSGGTPTYTWESEVTE